jgi:hypothetical protein
MGRRLQAEDAEGADQSRYAGLPDQTLVDNVMPIDHTEQQIGRRHLSCFCAMSYASRSQHDERQVTSSVTVQLPRNNPLEDTIQIQLMSLWKTHSRASFCSLPLSLAPVHSVHTR